MSEGTITFPFALEWEFLEADVSTGVKRSGGRVQMQEIRKMSRSRAADSVDNPETLEILPLKLGVGLNIAMHASPTARVFFFFF